MKGRVHWLLHLLHISITHLDGILHIQARVFGFLIYDNLKPKESKQAKNNTKNKIKKKTKKRIKKKTNKNGKSTSRTSRKTDDNKTRQNAGNQKVDKEVAIEKSITDKPVMEEKAVVTDKPGIDDMPASLQEQSDRVVTNPEAMQTDRHSLLWSEKSIIKNEISGNTNTKVILLQPEPDQNEKKESFFRKLMNRIRNMKEKIMSVVRKSRDKIGQIFTSARTFRNKGILIFGFLKDERNKEGMKLIFLSLKKLLKHVLPQKIRSKLIFGTGDPCSTGQALGVMSILYSFYGDRISIIPDFERNRLEGQHFVQGRIRLVTILIIVVKLIFDKRFKQLKNNFSILKEAL